MIRSQSPLMNGFGGSRAVFAVQKPEPLDNQPPHYHRSEKDRPEDVSTSVKETLQGEPRRFERKHARLTRRIRLPRDEAGTLFFKTVDEFTASIRHERMQEHQRDGDDQPFHRRDVRLRIPVRHEPRIAGT